MTMTAGDTATAISEDEFIDLSTTTPRSRFNLVAMRLMHRWHQQANDDANDFAYDPNEMTQAWQELDGGALVAEYG